MRKKFLLSFLLCFALCMLFVGATKAAEPTYSADTGYVLNGSQKCFFANGTPISIEERQDGQAGATIFWEDGTKNVNVPNDVNIFGGAHNDSNVYDSTKITMNGGTVKNIFGGGLHESHVAKAEIIVNAGTVTGSITGGGANVLVNSDYCADSNLPAINSVTTVADAYITVNNGTATMVYGGGEGMSKTENTAVRINGGTFDYVTAGGSNGYTGNADLKITSGEISLVQSVNRGDLPVANMRITGGTINKLYVGGETEDTSVTGKIGKVSLDVTGGSVVNNLYIGTSGGQKIGTAGNDTVADVDIYEGATVSIADETEFANVPVTKYVFITINEDSFELEKGKTLADLAEIDSIKNVEGKEFVKFVKKGTDETFDENTAIDTDTELEAIYKDKPTTDEFPKAPIDNTPMTGERNVNLMLTMFIILSGLVGVGLLVGKKD